MKCGHTAQGIYRKTGKPICVICAGFKKGYDEPVEVLPDLTGRVARCSYYRRCHNEVPSDYGLAFFTYRPDKEFDEYYCGCYGWD